MDRKNYRVYGLVLVGVAIIVYLGFVGNLNPFCSNAGFLGFLSWLTGVGACPQYNQPIALLILVPGIVFYFLGSKKHG